ncbi:MAG: carboxypeptidase-like regulatory domain-containing protein [Bacteroidales bacterium]|nr:carboxypeptidase-like regulatory domain-containing protein [Bacteroidales bacterium]
MISRTKRGFPVAFMVSVFLLVGPGIVQGQDLSELKVGIRSSGKLLHMVLDDLSKQTGYNFTFDSRLAESRKSINMELKDISIQDAIDTLFEDHTLTYRIIHKNIVIIPSGKIRNLASRDTVSKRYNMVAVSGIIRDSKSEKPLPYATVSLVNSNIGTISNENGSFVLRLPDTLTQPVLVTSYIGFKNQYVPVTVASDEPIEIYMNKNVISLQEVIIRYQDPAGLLTEAIKKIPVNYLNEPSGMKAYYREKVRKDNKCMIFSEAVVDIAKSPYVSSFTAERSRILKGRKLTNIDIQDTVVLKIRSGINTMLQLDIVKHPPDFLTPDFHLHYNLHFSDLVSYRDKLVYVISFSQKETVQETLFKGALYMDRESLAIIAADFEYDPTRIGREQDLFVAKKSRNLRIRPVAAKYHVEYAETDDRYGLSQVKGEVVFKVRKRRQWIASKYQINLELAVTDIEPGNPPRIRIGEQVKSSSIMAEETFEYDPEFWGDYNTIAPETSLTEALKRIENSIREITSE